VIAAACTHSTSADQAPTTSTTSNAPTVTDTPSGSSNPAKQWRLARRKITNVVFLVKENRTFDTFFGTFPGADGATQGQLCDGTTIPLKPATDDQAGATHSFMAGITAINGGKMNCFDQIDGGEGGAT